MEVYYLLQRCARTATRRIYGCVLRVTEERKYYYEGNVNDCVLHVTEECQHAYEQNVNGCLLRVTETREYCYEEHFTPRCEEQQVLVMESARYGRMRPGRCITNEFGNLGCDADVVGILDKQCSGKTECDVRVSNNNINVDVNCNVQLLRYLEASFTCTPGGFMPVKRPTNVCTSYFGYSKQRVEQSRRTVGQFPIKIIAMSDR